MASAFRLDVITQSRTLLSAEVTSVTAPGSEGYVGIWANHAPLATELIPGKLTVKDLKGTEQVYCLTGGFLEVSRNVVTVLADAVEAPGEIDYDRAKQAAERARKRLDGPREEIDVPRAEAALKRALLRMRLAHHQEPARR